MRPAPIPTHAARGFTDRKRVFKDNRLPAKTAPSIFRLIWTAYGDDKILILLTVAAIVSLAIGLYQSFGTIHTAANPPVEWVEGVAIIVAVVVIVLVGSVNDWEKQRQFAKLDKKKQDRNVKVIRSGKTQEIAIVDVLVGDVVHLEPGDIIPADGILINGYTVKCDESSISGESDLLRKHPGEEVFRAIRKYKNITTMDPFIVSGAKVAEGVGTFLVTATGVNSSYGKILISLKEDSGPTPLQSKLNTLAKYISKFGGSVSLIMFVVLFIKFLAQLPHSTETPAQKGQGFLNILIIALTVFVIAVPEGLPLAVTLALAFATTRMLKDNTLVRQLKGCETMGNATSICSDKTGTLTQNRMTVITGRIGTSPSFDTQDGGSVVNTTAGEFVRNLADDAKAMLKQSIAINSTAFEGEEHGWQTFIGSKTETALLTFARDHLGMGPVSKERSSVKTVQLIPFDATRQCMGTVVQLRNRRYRLYVKGASEVLLGKCARIVRDATKEISDREMSVDHTVLLNQVITDYASRSLRTIGLMYRDFAEWPPAGIRTVEDSKNEVVFEDLLKDLVFLCVFGIQDPLRDTAREAVQTCQRAGVVVRMVTGDNLSTAKAIAEDCGIFSATDIAMEGREFRKLDRLHMDRIIPSLRIIARSSPKDKQVLVTRLKELGETVAVTGDGTNDAPALAAADVGFSMGITGTEIAKEASSIVLLDDNFSSIVNAMMWGRTINDAVKHFLQFQVTVSVTSVMLTFVSSIASSAEQSVLTAVQLMWINLFQDTMAALALATDPATPSILDRKPDPKSEPLITIPMWKMVIGQSVYQLAVTLILYFGGATILSYETAHEQEQLQTLIFNTFVWMQIFNMYNNRRIDNNFNVFEGVTHNYLFIAVSLAMVGGQTLIVFVGGRAFSVTQLSGAQWAYSIVLGALSIPIGAIIRLVPNEFVRRQIHLFTRRRPSNGRVELEVIER